MEKSFRFFIAGIIQGSREDDSVHDQGYREQIKILLESHFPGSDVYCPVENHPNSTRYDDEQARLVFMGHIEQVKGLDCLVVYVPEASMGSAIEMWTAHENDVVIIAISPMRDNWVIRLLSHHICNDLSEFETLVRSGALTELLAKK